MWMGVSLGLATSLALAALVYGSVRETNRLVPAGAAVQAIPTVTPTSTPMPRPRSIINLTPSKDNTLYESATGSLSNGAGQHFFVGRTGQAQGSIRRGVITFNIAGRIPAGSTINSVSLRLNMSRTFAGSQTIGLHKLLADWGEGSSDAPGEEGDGTPATSGDATWVHRFFNTTNWATPGVDFSATVSASTSGTGVGSYTWGSAPQMVADVQRWLDNPASNFGWLLKGNEAVSQTTKRFDTRGNSTLANHPVLTISFTPPSRPGDVNGDGAVSIADLRLVVDNWGIPQDTSADLTGDKLVDISDLAIVGRNFGR